MVRGEARHAGGSFATEGFLTPTRRDPAESPGGVFAVLPDLREAMMRSKHFEKIVRRKRLVLDGEIHFIVRGDTLGSMEELYLDTLVRGSDGRFASEDERAVFEELTPEQQHKVKAVLIVPPKGA